MNLKTAVSVFVGLMLVVYLSLSLLLIKTTDLLDEEASKIGNAAESVRMAEVLKSRILIHNRNSLLGLHDRGEERLGENKRVSIQLVDSLDKFEKFVNDRDERETLEDVKRMVTSYLEAYDSLSEADLELEDRNPRIANATDNALESIDSLIQVNHLQMRGRLEKINAQNRRADLMATILFVVGGIVVGALVVGSIANIAKPLLELKGTMGQYAAGETSIRAKANGLSDIKLIASTFNEMADRLEDRRREQLRFISTVAHDIRNPLNSMYMASEILVNKSEGEDRDLHKIILRQLTALDRQVGDLLDTTRIEGGHLTLDVSSQDVREIVKAAVDLHTPGNFTHRIAYHMPDEPLICPVDSHRLSQVMNNLMSNALKYSPEGGGVIVNTWSEQAAVFVSVTDEGIGIDPKDVERIFKPFQRSRATKTLIPGIGLGLSVSRHIVEAHGGSLTVDSKLGEGSRFLVRLPKPPQPNASRG